MVDRIHAIGQSMAVRFWQPGDCCVCGHSHAPKDSNYHVSNREQKEAARKIDQDVRRAEDDDRASHVPDSFEYMIEDLATIDPPDRSWWT